MNEIKDSINLKLLGPYKLSPLVFDADISYKSGIYLWTVKYNNGYLIDYIGQTEKTFFKRMNEHLNEIVCGYYNIYNPNMLLQGKMKIIWNGPLHKKGTKNKINEFTKNYKHYAPIIKRYLEIHDIFLSPLIINKRRRELIEGNIAKIIKEQKSPISNLLHHGIRYKYDRKETEKEFMVHIECDCNIYGLPKFLKI